MDASLSVEPFTDADAGEVTDLLHLAYAELGQAGLNYTAVDQDVATTARRALEGRCWVVRAPAGVPGGPGPVIATMTLTMPPPVDVRALSACARVPTCAWLSQVAVHPSRRGSGIARQLWELARAWALGSGGASAGLDTAVAAEHLVVMYSSWGFTAQDLIRFPGKTYDSVVMTRDL